MRLCQYGMYCWGGNALLINESRKPRKQLGPKHLEHLRRNEAAIHIFQHGWFHSTWRSSSGKITMMTKRNVITPSWETACRQICDAFGIEYREDELNVFLGEK